MPFDIKPVKGGFYVITKPTGRKHSKKPLPKARAVKQLRALYLHTAGK